MRSLHFLHSHGPRLRSPSLNSRSSHSSHSPSQSPDVLTGVPLPGSPLLSPTSSAKSTLSNHIITTIPKDPVKLSYRIESPPLVLYGPHNESTGTLLCGIFDLEVLQSTPFAMENVYMGVYQKVTVSHEAATKSVATSPSNSQHHSHSPNISSSNGSKISVSNSFTTPLPDHSRTCEKCVSNTTELAHWDILTQPASLPKSVHGYPFSHLIPGSLPATSKNSVFSVEYYLKAVATPTDKSIAPFTIQIPLNIKRSIIGGPDRTSVRVFPPTDLNATVHLPSVVHPNSTFSFELFLEGISGAADSPSKLSRWRMRKINWRVDETVKMRAKLCDDHSESDTTSSSPLIEDVRTLNCGEIKGGWKTDFSGTGKIELSAQDISTHTLAGVCCNVDDPTLGLTVTHTLVMELVISEEAFQHKSSRHSVPTGAARVLRMQFNLLVTDHSGLGIAWDDEVPPVYADVPLSPPDYNIVADLPKFEEMTPNSLVVGQGINSSMSLCSPSLMSIVTTRSNDSTSSNEDVTL